MLLDEKKAVKTNKSLRVAVGLSGGVDSSVAAMLLKKAGIDVVGAHMRCWDYNLPGCKGTSDRADAIKVASLLDIPFVDLNFEKEYKKFVKHNPKRAEGIIKAVEHFITNPKHPSLNVEKLGGSNFWTMRLSEGNRLFFIWIDVDKIILADVGHHDKYKNY